MRLALTALALIFLVPLPGCGKKEGDEPDASDVRRVELDQIKDMYKLYVAEKARPPARLGDVEQYKEGFLNGYDALHKGTIIVLWGTPLEGEKALLAHDKETPSQGGLVLWNNGNIARISAGEFAAAPKRGS